MKKNLKSILAVSMALLLSIALMTGCGAAPAEQTAQIASGGVLLLSVNPEIAVTYDNDGNVTDLTARNEDAKAILAQYPDFQGKEARIVVSDLVTLIGEAGYFVEEVEGEGSRRITLEIEPGSALPSGRFLDDVIADVKQAVDSHDWTAPVRIEADELIPGLTDYNDTDYGPNNDGVTDFGKTDYDDTDYGPNNDGVTDFGKTDYDDTDYGPNNDGVTDFGKTDYDDTDYGPNNDGVTDFGKTDYDDTDYGPNNDGVTDYTDYGTTPPATQPSQPAETKPVKDTDYGKTDYEDPATDYGKTDYEDPATDYGKTDYEDPATDYGKTDYEDPATDYDAETNYDKETDYDKDSKYDDTNYGK